MTIAEWILALEKMGASSFWTIITRCRMRDGCRLNALYPEKTFYTKDEAVSDDMKKNTLNDVFHDSDTLHSKILLNLEVISQAWVAIKRMIAFGRCRLDRS